MNQASSDRSSNEFGNVTGRSGLIVSILGASGILSGGVTTALGAWLWGATELYSSSAGHTYTAGQSIVTLSFNHGSHNYNQVFYYGTDGKVIGIGNNNVPGCN
jgi:hypothetical protein